MQLILSCLLFFSFFNAHVGISLRDPCLEQQSAVQNLKPQQASKLKS